MTTSSERLAEICAAVADDQPERLADRPDHLCALGTRMLEVDGADAVIAVGGQHQWTVGASKVEAITLERLQYEAGEGPCLSAYITGSPVLVADVGAATDDYPTFAPAAKDRGFAAIYGFPLLLDGESLGAFNFYQNHPGPLSSSHTDDARLFAAMMVRAVAAIQHQREGEPHDVGSVPNLEEWRAKLEQAGGLVAAAHGVSVAEAKQWLRAEAAVQNRSVSEYAKSLASGEEELRI